VKQNENIVHGFKASGVQAGLKKVKALDLALIFSERESVAAGVFTTNRVQAAPIQVNRSRWGSKPNRGSISFSSLIRLRALKLPLI